MKNYKANAVKNYDYQDALQTLYPRYRRGRVWDKTKHLNISVELLFLNPIINNVRTMRNIVFLFLILGSSVSYAQTFEELTKSAINAENHKNYREAISLWNQALKLDEGNHFLFNKIGLMYYYLNQVDSAIIYYNLTLSKFPSDTVAHFQRGHCYLYKDEFQKALDDFLAAFVATEKKNPDASFNVGKSYAGLGNLEKAIEYYKITLNLTPNDKYSYYELGFCYASLPQPDKENALSNYNKAIQLDDKYYEPYLNRGLLYAVQFRNLKKAHQDLEKSIDIKPKNKLSYLYNGMLYRDEDILEKSEDMFNKVIALYPDYAEAYYERAINWYKIGILNMVCRDLNKAESLGLTKATEDKKKLCK